VSCAHFVRLEELHRRYIAEETAAAFGHDLRNKLAAIANANFSLKRRLERATSQDWQEDRRVPYFLEQISSELQAAKAILSKLPAHREQPGGVVCDAMAVLRQRIAPRSWPCSTVVLAAARGDPLYVATDALDLELALSCIIANSIDAESCTVRVQCDLNADGRVALEIIDDGSGLMSDSNSHALEPFFTTKPGRLGVGLNIASRIIARAQGELQLAARRSPEHGVRVALLLPHLGPDGVRARGTLLRRE
jgi:signal transduction histidine kinase